MTTLQRLESPESRPEIGGCLFTFSPTLAKVIHWQSDVPIQPVLEAAKNYTAQVLDALMKDAGPGAQLAIRETNWVSVVAGLQTVILEWNARLVNRAPAVVH